MTSGEPGRSRADLQIFWTVPLHEKGSSEELRRSGPPSRPWPQLGKRNLYRSTGGASIGTEINARLWVLNFSDGKHGLLDIAERSGMPFALLADSAELLSEAGLLSPVLERVHEE